MEFHKELPPRSIGIILVNSELLGLLELSDRIMVLYQARKTLELSSREFSQERILRVADGL